MSFIGNLLWIILGGLIASIILFCLGLFLCITIIGIPFGLQCFKLAKLTLAPFGKEVNINFDAHPIANIIWLIFVGIESAIAYLFVALTLCITIIGIPFAKQWVKLAKLVAIPFGAQID